MATPNPLPDGTFTYRGETYENVANVCYQLDHSTGARTIVTPPAGYLDPVYVDPSGAATAASIAAAVAAEASTRAGADATLTTAVGLKADASALTSGLAAKADASTTTTALAAKADTSAMTTALAAKADASATTTALAAKADATATTSALALKAPLASPALTGTPTIGGVAMGALATAVVAPTITTTSATTSYGWSLVTTVTPAGVSTALIAGYSHDVVFNGASAWNLAGHGIGIIGRGIRASGAATVGLLIGSEGAVQNLEATGTLSSAYAVAAHINANSGVISIGAGFHSQVTNNTGTITVHAHFLAVDQRAVKGTITSAWFALNLEPDLDSATLGEWYGPLGDGTATRKVQPLAPMGYPGYVSGRYYPGGIAPSTPTPIAISANLEYAFHIKIGDRQAFTKISFKVTTAASGKSVRCGIRKAMNGGPGDLVVDCGTVSVAATGLLEITFASTILHPGLYYLTMVSDGTPTIEWVYDPQAAMIHGSSADAGLDILPLATRTYGALPSSFGTISWTAASAFFPRLQLRV